MMNKPKPLIEETEELVAVIAAITITRRRIMAVNLQNLPFIIASALFGLTSNPALL
jgi:hypothetical protein